MDLGIKASLGAAVLRPQVSNHKGVGPPVTKLAPNEQSRHANTANHVGNVSKPTPTANVAQAKYVYGANAAQATNAYRAAGGEFGIGARNNGANGASVLIPNTIAPVDIKV